MTTVLEDQQRAGRFGRECRGEDVTDEALAGASRVGYVVDPDAVAEAILARLLAGRTLPRRP